jgi:ribosomal protein S27AE
MEKTCFKCGIKKDLSEFYAHPRMGDGHLNKCKDCAKKDERLRRLMNIDAFREKQTINRIENPERYRGYEKKRKRDADAMRKKTMEWRKANPEKYRAHSKVNNALRDGKITKPGKCQICGSDYFLHAHHEDYSRPLEVVWLCARCHGQIQ